MANVLQYDPADFTLVVGGYIIGGFADDEFVDVERDEDAYIKKVGVGGEVARMKNKNRSGRIIIRLMQSSPSNDALSLLAVLDEFGDFGAVPILARDHSGRSLFATPLGWIKKFPKAMWRKEVEIREWVLDTISLSIYVGGNKVA